MIAKPSTQLFTNPLLVRLWLGRIFSAIGDRFFEIAIVWIAAETQGTGAGFILASAGFSLGLVLAAPFYLLVSVSTGIAICGILYFGIGIWGALNYWNYSLRQNPSGENL